MNPPVHSSPLPRKGAFILDHAYHIELRPFRWWLTIDKDFVFDGASIPRAAWSILGVTPMSAKVQAASLVHDSLYATHYTTRAQADQIFYRLCRNDGISRVSALTMWAAIRAFGGTAWERSPTAIARARSKVSLTYIPRRPRWPTDFTAATATAAVALISSLMLSGCVNLTVNLGGTVNNVSVTKASCGDMPSGGNITDETNSNDGKLVLPLK